MAVQSKQDIINKVQQSASNLKKVQDAAAARRLADTLGEPQQQPSTPGGLNQSTLSGGKT